MASWAERLARRLQGAQVRFTRAQHDANLEYAIRETIREAAKRSERVCLTTMPLCRNAILAMLGDAKEGD